jgi:tartrate/fumarate subfamily iron-sulfur-dependent hydro-lyase beta chain
MDNIKHLQLPLGEDEARSLNVGDMVTVSGKVFTGRSRFHIRAIEDDILPPINFSKINTFFHVGPVMRQAGDEWKLVSIEPTSSIRFERYGADVVRKLKLRTLIGKTTMGPATTEALREIGGVYLTKIGICGNQLGAQVKNIETVYFLDELGKTEATWVFEVEKFGPFFVGIDSHGNNYFEKLSKEIEDNMPEINAKLGVPEDYDYTDVNSSVGK